MAEVKVLKEEGLKHEFSIVVPSETADKEKMVRLTEISKTAKMQGFRPGKVPMAVIEQHYGKEAYADALNKVVSECIDKTLADRKIRPALQPEIEWKSTEEGKNIEFTLKIEALPAIEVKDLGALAFERPFADVEDEKVDETIVKIAKRVHKPEAITDGSPAKMGDILVIDFDGSVDGKKFPGMKDENHSLELGTQSFIDTFEEQLVGSKVGDKKTVNVTFPEKYHAAELAGKKAAFDVTVKELRRHNPVELNDALGKELGFPSLEKLRERLKDDMGVDYKRISRSVVKRALMDELAKIYTFEVPQGLLETEFNGIWNQIEEARKKNELPDEDKNKSEEELRSEYRSIAERRIRLGLLLAEIATENKIEVTNNELRAALSAEARRYPGQEKAVYDYYMKTRGAIERIRAPILEEKVVDFIIGKAKVTDKKVSAKDLLAMPEEE